MITKPTKADFEAYDPDALYLSGKPDNIRNYILETYFGGKESLTADEAEEYDAIFTMLEHKALYA